MISIIHERWKGTLRMSFMVSKFNSRPSVEHVDGAVFL